MDRCNEIVTINRIISKNNFHGDIQFGILCKNLCIQPYKTKNKAFHENLKFTGINIIFH